MHCRRDFLRVFAAPREIFPQRCFAGLFRTDLARGDAEPRRKESLKVDSRVCVFNTNPKRKRVCFYGTRGSLACASGLYQGVSGRDKNLNIEKLGKRLFTRRLGQVTSRYHCKASAKENTNDRHDRIFGAKWREFEIGIGPPVGFAKKINPTPNHRQNS